MTRLYLSLFLPLAFRFFHSPLASRYLSPPKAIVKKMNECKHRLERSFLLASLTRQYLPSLSFFRFSFAASKSLPFVD
jgi:hypothetical protein